MQNFFGLLYFVFLSGCVIAALFILFHLLRYALDRKLALLMSLIFTTVTLILLVANIALYFSLPLENFLPNNYSLSSL